MTPSTKRRLRFIFLVFLYFAGGLGLATVSKYLLPDEALKRAIARIVSPFTGHFLYDTSARDQITIFALDDRDLTEYNTTYPVPYRFHAQRLRNIASYRPRAIFIDFWFPDERDDPQVAALAEEICRMRAAGVRVYLGSLAHHGSSYALRSVLRDLKNHLVEVPEGGRQPCAVEVSVAKQTDSLDRITWEYDLQSEAVEGTDGTALQTAGARIYNDLYLGAGMQREDPIALNWGTDPHPLNAAWMLDRRNEKPLCRGTWNWLTALPVLSTIAELTDPGLKAPLCPYHLMLPLRALRELNQEDHPWQTSLEELIEDKIIIYGGNLQSVDDLVYSPVHGRLPGLFMHAMALDNLITHGQDYPAAGDFDIQLVGKIPTSTVPFFAVLLLSVVAATRRMIMVDDATRAFARALSRRVTRLYGLRRGVAGAVTLWTKAGPIPKRFLRFVGKTLFAVVMLSIVAVLAAWLQVGMLTWIEFAVLPMLLGFLEIGDKVIGWIEEWFPALSTNFDTIPNKGGIA